ncbi:MAG: response regulator [Rhizobacter sp.]|nr:response regulator [Rhizobacter sp.]
MHGKVLYIEDEPVHLELIEVMLAGSPGITLIKTTTGREGVRLAQTELPDVILLDLHLPDISGLEVVRSLSEQIAKRQFRVVLLTGDSFSIDIVKAMSLGAAEYWIKPITLERLESGLARVLQAR